jgi:hypothetical protein
VLFFSSSTQLINPETIYLSKKEEANWQTGSLAGLRCVRCDVSEASSR